MHGPRQPAQLPGHTDIFPRWTSCDGPMALLPLSFQIPLPFPLANRKQGLRYQAFGETGRAGPAWLCTQYGDESQAATSCSGARSAGISARGIEERHRNKSDIQALAAGGRDGRSWLLTGSSLRQLEFGRLLGGVARERDRQKGGRNNSRAQEMMIIGRWPRFLEQYTAMSDSGMESKLNLQA